MGPYYQKPENALRRADELIAVGQQAAALESLQEIVLSKRSRSLPVTSLEQIMLKLVELSVELKKTKVVKEALHQYKNVTQNTSVTTIEVVVRHLVTLSEAKVAEAQAEADKILLDVDDLEASETPESILLSTVSGEQNKDRTDRAVVTPWLKFLWEAYRNVLDILRNNSRLELLYEFIAEHAFKFCLKYLRQTEFRRLCDLLRNHLSSAAKYSHQTHAINLNEAETLQRHLDIRFQQLNGAVDLELWQEAFRSIEDIHNLIMLAKKPPKASMMTNYYLQLTKIFLVGENYLFHAAASLKYYQLWRSQGKFTIEEHHKIASMVLLAILAIPIITPASNTTASGESDDIKPKVQRLVSLLGLNIPPTRQSLLREILSRNVLQNVPENIKQLYYMLEVRFHPLSVCKNIGPLVEEIKKDDSLQRYVEPLKEITLTRLLQQLSQVFSSIKIANVVNLASPFGYSIIDIEKFVMNGCRKGELSITIDHLSGSLTFETSDLFAVYSNVIPDGPKLQQATPSVFRAHLSKLSSNLSEAVTLISGKSKTTDFVQHAIEYAKIHAEEEHQRNLENRIIIEKRKEQAEALLLKKEKAEALERHIKVQAEMEAEKKRLEEESKKREEERIRLQHEDIQREEARKIADSLRAKGAITVDDQELDNLDKSALIEIQVEQLEKAKTEMNNRLRTIAKKLDHTERAYRREEIPLLEQDYEQQKKSDRAHWESAAKSTLQLAELKFTKELAFKRRFLSIKKDFMQFKEKIKTEQLTEFEIRRSEAESKLEEAKRERIETYQRIKSEIEERKRIEREERERSEAEEIARMEEEERLRREKEEKEERERLEYEEKMRKLDEVARKQQERERESEERAAKRREEERQQKLKSIKKVEDDSNTWRKTPVPAAAPAAETEPALRRSESAWRPRIRESKDDVTKSEGHTPERVNSKPASPRPPVRELGTGEEDEGFTPVASRKKKIEAPPLRTVSPKVESEETAGRRRLPLKPRTLPVEQQAPPQAPATPPVERKKLDLQPRTATPELMERRIEPEVRSPAFTSRKATIASLNEQAEAPTSTKYQPPQPPPSSSSAAGKEEFEDDGFVTVTSKRRSVKVPPPPVSARSTKDNDGFTPVVSRKQRR